MLKLDRRTLGQFLPNHEAIRTFESLLDQVDLAPTAIEEAAAQATLAIASATQALAILAELSGMLEQLMAAPAQQLGTISSQNADAVEITGGTAGLDAGTVAAPSFYLGGDRTTGLYRSAADALAVAIAGVQLVELSNQLVKITGALSVTKQLTSTVGTGTAPFVVVSTTKVDNLYVARAALADEATHAINADHATTADSAGTANSLTSPSAFPADATDLPTVIALANALKAAALSKGL